MFVNSVFSLFFSGFRASNLNVTLNTRGCEKTSTLSFFSFKLVCRKKKVYLLLVQTFLRFRFKRFRLVFLSDSVLHSVFCSAKRFRYRKCNNDVQLQFEKSGRVCDGCFGGRRPRAVVTVRQQAVGVHADAVQVDVDADRQAVRDDFAIACC